MSEANKDLIRRYQAAYNNNRLDELDNLLDPNWHTNGWPAGVPQSIESAKAFYQVVLEVFPDLHYATEELVAEGNHVVQRWTLSAIHKGEFIGLQPTGRRVTAGGMSLFTIVDDRIVEHWAFGDELGFLAQLGAEVPAEWLAIGHRST
jgi:predicted ester cyclase